MRTLPTRRHIPHSEHPGGTVCLTWRLHRSQPPLRPEERSLVIDVVRHDDGGIGDILAGVVMDDHAHILVSLYPGTTCRRVAQTWKSVSSHRMTKFHGRSAPVWQREYFDRWIMTGDRVRRAIEYVLANPIRRWPGLERYEWIIPARWIP